MAINDTVQLSVLGQVAGQQHVHTLHFRQLFTGSGDQGLIDAWQAGCRTAYRAMFRTTDQPVLILRAAQVCGATPLRIPAEEAEESANQAGTTTASADRFPSWVAAIVSLRTPFAGKSYRGRFYVGGLNEDWVAGDNIVAAHKSRLAAYANALMATFGPSSSDWRWVIHSRKLAGVSGTSCTDSSFPVTSILVRDAVGTMRSRRAGSGV